MKPSKIDDPWSEALAVPELPLPPGFKFVLYGKRYVVLGGPFKSCHPLDSRPVYSMLYECEVVGEGYSRNVDSRFFYQYGERK